MGKKPEVEPIRMTDNPKNIVMIDKDDISSSYELDNIAVIRPDYMCPDSDIAVYDAAIYRDYDGNAYIDLRLANIGDYDVLGIYFRVVGYSESGEKLGTQEYSLIDLEFKPCTVFNTGAIRLFNSSVTRVKVDITRIINKDYQSKDVKLGRLVPMPKLVMIGDKLDNIVVEILGLKEDEIYFVDHLGDNFHICTCGHLRKDKCPVCGRTDGLDNDMNEVSARIKETINNIVGNLDDIDSLDSAINTRTRLDRHLMTIATLRGFDDVKQYGKEGIQKLDKKIKKLEKKARRGKKPLIIALVVIALIIIAGVLVYQAGGIEWLQSIFNK